MRRRAVLELLEEAEAMQQWEENDEVEVEKDEHDVKNEAEEEGEGEQHSPISEARTLLEIPSEEDES